MGKKLGYHIFIYDLVKLYNSTDSANRSINREEDKWFSISIHGIKGHIQDAEISFFTGEYDPEKVKEVLNEMYHDKGFLKFE